MTQGSEEGKALGHDIFGRSASQVQWMGKAYLERWPTRQHEYGVRPEIPTGTWMETGGWDEGMLYGDGLNGTYAMVG